MHLLVDGVADLGAVQRHPHHAVVLAYHEGLELCHGQAILWIGYRRPGRLRLTASHMVSDRIPSTDMNAAVELRSVRLRAGLTLRELARRAGTSHATLAAYESGRKAPSVATFDRIVRAAGFRPDLELTKSVGGADPADRGRELVEVLELAGRFPARHSRTLRFPRFRPRVSAT